MSDFVTIPAVGTGDSTPKVYALDYGTEGKKQVVQYSIGLNPSSSFTRPANTTSYSSGQLVANSTTAGSVVPMSWVCSDTNAVTGSKASFKIVRGRLKKSQNTTTNATFAIQLFGSDPSASSGISVGDGGTFAGNVKDATFLGTINTGLPTSLNDCAISFATPSNAASAGIVVAQSSGTIYGLLTTVASGYAPLSSEVFTITLEINQD